MRILDCNLNFGATNNGEPYRNCDTFEELLAELDRCGIGGGLVRCGYSSTVGVNYGNDFVARCVTSEAAKRYDLYGVWAVIPPYTDETPKPEALPGAMKQNRVGAVYLSPRVHRYELNALTMGAYLDVLQQTKIPVILNTANGIPMDAIYRVMADFPRLTAIVGDSDCWPNARRLYPLAYRYENLRLDLSYIMDAGGIEDMTRRFGAEKLLFGTAFPYRYTGSMLAVTRAAAIAEADRETIFGGNLANMIEEAGLR
ncbi:MAG: amidohydrolase family protein [Clostridia bacterium]|nr:amidohydrolase family protein [Clostridia bacterium]